MPVRSCIKQVVSKPIPHDVTEVVLVQRGLDTSYTVLPVDKHTATQVVVRGRRYRRDNGYAVGSYGHRRDFIQELTPENRERLELQATKTKLRDVSRRLERICKQDRRFDQLGTEHLPLAVLKILHLEEDLVALETMLSIADLKPEAK